MRRVLTCWAIVLLAMPMLVSGQAQTTGNIEGRVLDEGGEPIAGASVTVTSESRNFERENVTGADGRFVFALLPVGSYLVTATLAGYEAQVLRVPVRIGETVPLDVALVAGGEMIVEQMTVVGTASAMETTSTGDSFAYDELINQLPVVNRELEDIALLAPNVSFGPSVGTVSISGAPSFDTTMLLDGAEVSDPYFGSAPVIYLEDAIEEVQILTSGVDARYGRFQGGVVNAVTKSGGNDFEGGFRLQLENQDWDSTTPFGEEQEDDLRKTYQAVLGGPVLQDRLWFFVGGRTIPESSAANTTRATNETFVTTQNEDRWQAKLSGALGPSHLVEVSHLDYARALTNTAGLPAGDLRASRGRREDPRTFDTLAYQGVLSDSTFVELQATRKEVDILSGGDSNGRSPFIDLVSFSVFNNHWWDFDDPSERNSETASAALTQFLSSDRWGAHEIEGGVQYVNSITGGENRQSNTGFNLLTFNPDFYAGQVGGEPRFNLVPFGAVRWVALGLEGEQELENLALYLRDSIELDRWRFDIGARWETYEGKGPTAPLNVDFSELAPRLGVTYSLAPDWQVQATYGRYVSRFNDNVGNNLTGVGAGPLIETLYAGPALLGATYEQIENALRNDTLWPFLTDVLDPEQPTNFPASDLAAPYSDDITLSLRHSFPTSRGSAVLSYVDREFHDLIDDFIGLVCSDQGFEFERPCPSGDYSTIVTPAGEAVVDTRVWANSSEAFREYQALTLVVDYYPLPRWMVGGNYTYSRLRGNYEGEATNQPASGSSIGDWPLAQAPGASRSGTLFGDIPHRLNLWSTFQLPTERFGSFVLGSVLQYRSGLPWSREAFVPFDDVPAYVSTGASYLYVFERGGDRFDDVWSLDGSVRYEIPLWRSLAPWAMLSVTNLLDNDTVIQHSVAGDFEEAPDGSLRWIAVGNCGPGDAPSTDCSDFGRIRNEADYQLPRMVQASVGIRF